MTIQRPFSVTDKEAPRLIRRLTNFLGTAAVERALTNYEKALQTSGPILKTYYTPYRHPWWDSLKVYLEFEKAGKSAWKYMKGPFERSMIGDAYKIGVLQAGMPESVRNKFRRDLIDDNNAWAYLFEIQMASHYYQYGYDISWYEDDGNPRPEFKVTADNFEFDIECKRISVDASRKVRRVDFYRLAELLLPEISKRTLSGTIEIELNGKLPPSATLLKSISDQIHQTIPEEGIDTVEILPFGQTKLSLSPRSGREVRWEELYAALDERKHPSAHGVILAQGNDRVAKDPIEMVVVPKQSEEVLKGIEGKIKSASKQFDGIRPGLICCYLEGIGELSGLAEEGGLKIMSNLVLNRPDMTHIIGVSYCAEPRLERSGNADSFSNQGLIFKNPNCKFTIPTGVKFLTNEV